jgi:hypothetical protein
MKENKGCHTFLITEDAGETKHSAFLHQLLHDGNKTVICELKLSSPHKGADKDFVTSCHLNW